MSLGPRTRWAFLAALAILAGLAVVWVFRSPHTVAPAPLPAPPSAAVIPAGTHPAWRDLLSPAGTGESDARAAAELVATYLTAVPLDRRPPLGSNEEWLTALSDTQELGDAALPRDHPARVRGQLVDRWGTPWHFHLESSRVATVRSAGPDRRLFTDDDLTAR